MLELSLEDGRILNKTFEKYFRESIWTQLNIQKLIVYNLEDKYGINLEEKVSKLLYKYNIEIKHLGIFYHSILVHSILDSRIKNQNNSYYNDIEVIKLIDFILDVKAGDKKRKSPHKVRLKLSHEYESTISVTNSNFLNEFYNWVQKYVVENTYIGQNAIRPYDLTKHTPYEVSLFKNVQFKENIKQSIIDFKPRTKPPKNIYLGKFLINLHKYLQTETSLINEKQSISNEQCRFILELFEIFDKKITSKVEGDECKNIRTIISNYRKYKEK